MKIRLPKMLLAAVLASMSTGAYAVNPTGSIDVDAVPMAIATFRTTD